MEKIPELTQLLHSHTQPSVYRLKLDSAGRVLLPIEVRRSIGVNAGDDVYLQAERDSISIKTLDQIVNEIQTAFAPLKKEGQSVVDEFLAERREEAGRE